MARLIDFSIVIPAYNEAGNIIATVRETSRVLEGFNPDYEILVINDGSTDDTLKNVRDFLCSNNKKVRLEGYSRNKGKGFALKYGAERALGNMIIFLDADLDLHPSLIIDLFNIMQQSGADVVIGSKMHKNSVLNYPLLRKILSRTYYLISSC
jgi:glycosyltransferase involved in cell wall biosynthesis